MEKITEMTETKTQMSQMSTSCVVQEAYSYWQQCLEGVDKPAARKLIENLDMTNPLGIKHSLGLRRGARYSKAPLYSFFLEVKQQHPTKVLLVRVRCCAPLLPFLLEAKQLS